MRPLELTWGWLVQLSYTAVLLVGFAVHALFKKTPAYSYQSMVKLFCRTRGRSNDLLSRAISIFRRPYHLEDASGVLGNMSDAKSLQTVVSALRNRGYYVFERRLSVDACTRLLRYATSHPCNAVPMDGQESSALGKAPYPREHPRAVRYEFAAEDLLANPDVQALLADMSFVAIAQSYLGAKPIVDVLSMWWHTGFSERPDSRAAQYFHFDMDRPKWLKFFIYLTDVEISSGPHVFVAGSHQSRRIPASILSKGYVRLTDKEVEKVFGKDDIVEFIGPRGTIIAEDTRGLHKGKHVENADRLILQIQFSNSLFGGTYPKVSFQQPLIPDLQNKMKKFRLLYSAYH